MVDGSKAGTQEPHGPSTGDHPPALYSLQHALQDFALVFFTTTVVYLAIVLSGLDVSFIAWADAYPRLEINTLFLYGILLSVGFGMAILRRWIQLSDVLRRQERIRQELAKKAEALEQSNRELERFAYAASHDLREPLRMIHSYLGLLERRVEPKHLDEDATSFLNEARNASERMERMVRGILEYARLDPEATTSDATDADRALDRALRDIHDRLEARDVTIDREPLPSVRARPNELAIVFQNLVENALVHGGPELDRIEIRGLREGDRVRIRVRDDGSGFDVLDEDQAFDLFRQGNGSSTSAGAGLGLSLCRRIIELHGGSIEAASEPGDGTTIEIHLPAATPSHEDLAGFTGATRESAEA